MQGRFGEKRNLFELERGTALKDFGQRLALRQILEASDLFEQSVPWQPVKPIHRNRKVVTNILDEDLYPVGGYTSISNRGTIESLLHSQLAYLEEDTERPDLFDIKFLRDELLYYSRDENQFFRRRRVFFIGIGPDFTQARVKDDDLGFQRSIVMLSLLYVTIQTITHWLSDDSLTFIICFPDDLESHKNSSYKLREEQELLELLLHQEMEQKIVQVRNLPFQDIVEDVSRLSRKSLCHVMMISWKNADELASIPNIYQMTLDIEHPLPVLAIDEEMIFLEETDSLEQAWQDLFLLLLRAWIAE